jgi:hypothetical protein
MTERLTDLGEQMDAIRADALRRIYVAEGRRMDYRYVDFTPGRRDGRKVYYTTEELVARVESHAGFLLDNEESGFGRTSLDRLGRWSFA